MTKGTLVVAQNKVGGLIPWSAISNRFVSALANGLEVDGGLLRSRSKGISRAFVRKNWPQVRDSLIATDTRTMRRVVDGLLDAGLGPTFKKRPYADPGRERFLLGCKRSEALVEIVYAELWAKCAKKISKEAGTSAPPKKSESSSSDDYVGFRSVATGGGRQQLPPYDHQRAAWSALNAATPLKGGLLVLPTGAGKTFTAVSWLADHVLSGEHPRPVLWLAHRAELLEQAARAFESAAGGIVRADKAPLTIRCISGAHGNGGVTLLANADVICASVASLRDTETVRKYFKKHPDAFVVVDEAHHSVAKTWRSIIQLAQGFKRVEVLGLTATPTRTVEAERGVLAKLFPMEVLYEISSAELVAAGVLARPVCESVLTGQSPEEEFTAADLAHLNKFGDLSARTLNRLGASVARNKVIINRYLSYRKDYGPTLLFATGIAQCSTLVDQLQRNGVRAAQITYASPDLESDREILDRFKRDEIDVLCTVTKLTEGFDLPNVNTVFLTRPTGSRILLSQMIGRGMRGPSARGAKGYGTETVRIVSFDDHWDRFADWLDPIEFVNGAIAENPTERAYEPTTRVDVPWELFLEIARLRRMDEGFDNPTVQAMGWYDLRSTEDGSASTRHVLVFDHQEESLSRFLEGRLGNADGAATEQAIAECASPRPSDHALSALSRYVEATGQMPPLVRFVDFDKVDPTKLAARFDNLDESSRNAELDEIYSTDDLARLLFPTVRSFADAVYRVILDRRFGDHGFDETIRIDTRALLEHVHPFDWQLRSMAKDARATMGLRKSLPREIGFTSRPMKSYWGSYWPEDGGRILINQVLESDLVAPETMQFLLYHELLHHELGVDEGHSDQFRKRERMFPGWREADAELDTLRERYRLP